MKYQPACPHLGDIAGRHGVAGEAARGHHHVIALLPQSGGADTANLQSSFHHHHHHHHLHHHADLAPDVVAVEVATLEVAEGRHVLVNDVHLEVSSGLDTGGHVPGLGAQLQNL